MELPNSPIVDINWLNKAIIKLDNLIILDASFPTLKDGTSTLYNKWIPGSLYFDIKKDFSDQESDLPHTCPNKYQFEEQAKKLGINKDSILVVYDRRGMYSSPRAWWLFKYFSHQQVYILNGGFPAWEKANFPVAKKAKKPTELGNFTVQKTNSSWLIDFEDIKQNIQSQNLQLIDARSSYRFLGIRPDARPYLQSDHIPNSINIHYQTLLIENAYFKPKEELKAIFISKYIKLPIVFSCGSGITACIVMVAFFLAFEKEEFKLFDGSWTEWATKNKLFR
jgi:thiosulfate/3-mercaptopyruvate sulfurtransferase